MQDSTAPSGRARAVAAVAMIVAVIALFAWLTHSSVAGAASATPSNTTPAATQPYGSNDAPAPAAAQPYGSNGSAGPAAGGRGPCPEDQQGSGGSGSQPQAPSQGQSESAPSTTDL